jgi:hypothetical protein
MNIVWNMDTILHLMKLPIIMAMLCLLALLWFGNFEVDILEAEGEAGLRSTCDAMEPHCQMQALVGKDF